MSLSDVLGYACIGCWLGAQFPQVVENIRRRSCDGLALPFLANWLLGDISNLVGCILTHQLPFQTWLAIYFVLVDLTLVGQYIYYEHVNPTKPRPSKLSVDRATPRYRTLSAMAANVAAVAALAAQEGGDSSARWPRHDGSTSAHGLYDEPEEDYGPMANSFHSERGADFGRKRVSWSVERLGPRSGSIGRYPPQTSLYPSVRMTSSSEVDVQTRGRTLQRDGAPSTENTRQSRASRRSANMIFLSVFALFSIGTIAGSKRGSTDVEPTHLGRVLSSDLPPVAVTTAPSTEHLNVHDDRLFEMDDHPHHEPAPSQPPSGERVLGRIFAWLCTTLYLTSRLPQIWKNFVRKSVEGLSMYLFLFAFLGNSFYVASIVTSPKFFATPPASIEFIKESIPYLLGSAGTLMFDVTILTQSYIYRPKPRRQRTRANTVEEEAGLLSGDSVNPHPPYSSNDSVVHSRGRTSSTPRDTE